MYSIFPATQNSYELKNLGYVPFNELSEKTDHMSLLNLAISLRHTNAKFFPKKRTIDSITLKIHKDTCIIEMKFSKKREVYWKISTTPIAPIGTLDFFELGSTKMENRRYLTREKYVIHSTCNNDILASQKLIETMFTVFNPVAFNLYINRKCNLSNIISFKGLNSVDNLTFIVYNEMTDKEFLLFREKVHPKKSLVFKSALYDNQKHGSKAIFNCETLNLVSAKWLTEEDFWNIKCKKVDLEQTNLNNRVMNNFIKSWMNGATPIETLKVEYRRGDLDEVLSGTQWETTESIMKKKNMRFKTLEFAFDQPFEDPELMFTGIDGRHLTRFDGKMATVELKANQKLYFVVWNDESPKIVDINIFF